MQTIKVCDVSKYRDVSALRDNLELRSGRYTVFGKERSRKIDVTQNHRRSY